MLAAILTSRKPKSAAILLTGTSSVSWTACCSSAGSNLPNGIIFTPAIGGLPALGGKAANFFINHFKRLCAEAKKAPSDICSKAGQDAVLKRVLEDYAKHKGDLKPYLMAHCGVIKKLLASTTRFPAVTHEAAKAYFNNLPQLLKLVPDPAVLAAVIQLQLTYHLDSADGRFIIF